MVSSSFDADRLDYLRRDRLMTGTGAGAIDFDWLMEHVRVSEIMIEASDAGEEEGSVKVPTFCLDAKALPAAEQFLLARFTLHRASLSSTRPLDAWSRMIGQAFACRRRIMLRIAQTVGDADGIG